MARIFRLTVALHESNDGGETYCIEAFEKVRMGFDNRVLHFGIPVHPEKKDVEWVTDVLGAELESLFSRTTGIVQRLEF